jgi:4'-phosphopantetheinyl transferase
VSRIKHLAISELEILGAGSAPDWRQMSRERICVHFGLLDAIDTPQAYQTCLAMLSSAERQRAGCFVFERHRRQYIFAHGLLRVALSCFVPDVKPSNWCFVANRYGRPYVAAPAIGQAVYFSISHTDGCVACVVSDCEAVGVDVEEIRERQSLWAIAQSNFSPEEIGALRALTPENMADRFFDYWTLKEAYLKARGTGMNLPLNQFSMLVSSDHKISIRFAAGIAGDSRRWRFMTYSPSARHRLAVADGSGQTARIVVQPWLFSQMP